MALEICLSPVTASCSIAGAPDPIYVFCNDFPDADHERAYRHQFAEDGVGKGKSSSFVPSEHGARVRVHSPSGRYIVQSDYPPAWRSSWPNSAHLGFGDHHSSGLSAIMSQTFSNGAAIRRVTQGSHPFYEVAAISITPFTPASPYVATVATAATESLPSRR